MTDRRFIVGCLRRHGRVLRVGDGALTALPKGWAAVETDDPVLVAEIDAADAAVHQAEEQLRAAKRERQEVLAGLVPRCKPARIR